MKFHRIISVLLALSLCFSMCAPVSATESATPSILPESGFEVPLALPPDEKAFLGSIFSDIPVFITVFSQSGIEYNSAQAQVSSELNNHLNLGCDTTSSLSTSTKALLEIESAEYSVTELSILNKSALLDNSLFVPTFSQVASLVENGIEVGYVNFYMLSNPFLSTLAASREDDPAYWESVCMPLGTYNGYKFLYLESEINISTPYVDPSNLSSSFNWGNLLTSVITTSAEMALDYTSKVVSVAYSTISAILGSIETPLSVNYGATTQEKIKTRVVGTLYTRSVLIRDDNDRIHGYAYYAWGSTQQSKLQQGAEVYYPINQRTATTYDYVNHSGTSSSIIMNATPGFWGGSDLFQKIINYYNSTAGYRTYDESLEIQSTLYSILEVKE